MCFFFFSSRRRHTRWPRDWSSDVCSSDLDSLGFFYSAITGYLGFEVNEGEYKVMGLAPYGEPVYADEIRKLIEVTSEGQYRLNMKYFGFLTEDCMYTQELIDLLGQPPRVA